MSLSELDNSSSSLAQDQPSHRPPVSPVLQSASTESLLRIAVYGSGKQRRQAMAMLSPCLRREVQQSRHEQAWPER